jgi:hypothetical protein
MRRFVSGMRNFAQLGHVPVLGDEVFHFFLAMKAPDHRNVDNAGRLRVTAAHLTDLVHRHVQKHRQAFTPLIEELLAMDDNERVDAALRDQPRRDCRLAAGVRPSTLSHRLA